MGSGIKQKTCKLSIYLQRDFIVLDEEKSIAALWQIYRENPFFVCFASDHEQQIRGFITLHTLCRSLLDKKKKTSQLKDLTTPIALSLQGDTSHFAVKNMLATSSQEVIPVFVNQRLTGYLSGRENLLQEALNQQAEYTRKLEQRDDFIGIVSHDIRSPLGVISVCCDYLFSLDEEEHPLNELHKDFVVRIKRNVDKALALVSDLLDLGKLKAGAPLSLKETKLPDFLAGMISNLQYLADSRDIEVVLEKTQPVITTLDPNRMLQVIENLVGNAIKFSPQGSKIYLSCTFCNAKGMPEAKISVRDEGRGIAHEKLEQLFERYQQGDERIDKELGYGLGLSIAQQFTQLHGGRITVASEMGKGSTFSVILPHARRGEATVCKPETIRILVAEDDQDILEFMSEILTDRGLEVVKAGDGQVALQVFQECSPQIVISDIRLPKTDGFELLEQIKNLNATIPFILMSGYYATIQDEQAQNIFHADKILAKPFEESDLLAALEDIFQKYQLNRPFGFYSQENAAS